MVEITYLAIAGIALAAMFFGYGFGLFEGRAQGYRRRKAEEEQEKKNQPPPESVSVTVEDPGLLRIKEENGLPTLDLDGQRVDTASLSPQQRKRLIEMLNLMRPWLEGRAAPAPLTETSLPSRQPGAVASVSAASPPVSPQPALPPVSTGTQDDRPSAPASSIISQIDAILQARMAGTTLEGRRVFLAQAPDGGVIVYVGLTRYMSVDDVPDAEVKAAIRGAISEWENKYTPGL